VPIFVLTHDPPKIPPKQDERLTFTFVTEGVASAIAQAKAAAGERQEESATARRRWRTSAARRQGCRRGQAHRLGKDADGNVTGLVQSP
jgi:hypothetical protein